MKWAGGSRFVIENWIEISNTETLEHDIDPGSLKITPFSTQKKKSVLKLEDVWGILVLSRVN